jgi:thiol:disulfide interchange protein DsbG
MIVNRHVIALGFLWLVGTGQPAAAAEKDTAAEKNAAAYYQKRADGAQQAAAAIWPDIGRAAWAVDGKSAHVVYVFFDPNCPYCHRLYETLRPWIGRGDLEARWIPTGTLMTTSPGKAAAILEAPNRTEALHENERRFSRETGAFGGITEEPLPRDETVKQLAVNLELLKRTGDRGVPMMLYRLKDGSVRAMLGAPPGAFFEKLVKEVE